MITFVALLMFLQLGTPAQQATLFSSLLFLPWVLKSFLRSWVGKVGHFKEMLHLIEWLIFFSLTAVALSFPRGQTWLFVSLLVTSSLCAWHKLVARMYYEHTLRIRDKLLLTIPKMVFTQTAVIFTYGALIFIVASLQVILREIRAAWSMGCYITAGVFLFFTLLHFLTLRSMGTEQPPHRHSMLDSVKEEIHVIERIQKRPRWWRVVLTLFFILLPQSLLFYTRVLYLFDTNAHGGLECTMQEIGFAQGTVGVIAFSLGLAWGRHLMRHWPMKYLLWVLCFIIGLSPMVYFGMTLFPPQELGILSLCTFMAQLFFGIGLCACRLPIQEISDMRYKNSINLLYIPLVSGCMILPMALSGWLVQQWGYSHFFLFTSLCSPVTLVMAYLFYSYHPDA